MGHRRTVVDEYFDTIHSFREKIELRLREVNDDLCKSSDCCTHLFSTSTNSTALLHEECVDTTAKRHDDKGKKNQTDEARTEGSVSVPMALQGIGSYDDEECVIWYTDSMVPDSGYHVGKDNQSEDVVSLSTGFGNRYDSFLELGIRRSKKQDGNKQEVLSGFRKKSSAATSRKLFALCKVPAPIVEVSSHDSMSFSEI
jgi:hypothetical protein